MNTFSIHFAAKYGHVDLIEFLLDHGAKINARDGMRMTALHEAAHHDHSDVVSYLV